MSDEPPKFVKDALMNVSRYYAEARLIVADDMGEPEKYSVLVGLLTLAMAIDAGCEQIDKSITRASEIIS
jgi:hypothetical protein